jgi:hypothetical protein
VPLVSEHARWEDTKIPLSRWGYSRILFLFVIEMRIPVLAHSATNCVLNHVRFEVSTSVTMKNVVFLDIKAQFVLHRRHITSPLQSPAS